jgi:hypothetical protein
LIEWELILVQILPVSVVATGNAMNGGGVAGNAISGVSHAVGVGASDTTNGVGGNAASFVTKVNFSIAARAVCVFWYSFQRFHDLLKQSAVLFARI